MGDRDYFRKNYMRPKGIFQPGADNAIISLIIVHLVVFTIVFGLWLVYIVTYESGTAATAPFQAQILDNLYLPATAAWTQPWSFVSYMFTHFGFWGLFSNMLWLWAFGQIFQSIAGSDKVFPVFIYGGVAGAIGFAVSSLLLQQHLAPLLTGAGAGVVSMAIATTTMSPDYRLFPMIGNGIPLWILTAVFVIIDLGTASYTSNTLIAHVTAGLMGFAYVVLLRQGKDIGAWMNHFAQWLMDLFNPEKKYKTGKKESVFYEVKKEPYVKKPNLTQRKLDELLDKINQHGYDSLTDAEKEFLKKASEHL